MLTEWLWLTGAGIRVFEDSDSNKQRTELHQELWSYLLWGDFEGEEDAFVSPDIEVLI